MVPSAEWFSLLLRVRTSAPPHTQQRAFPQRISSAPTRMLSEPAEQAVETTTGVRGPRISSYGNERVGGHDGMRSNAVAARLRLAVRSDIGPGTRAIACAVALAGNRLRSLQAFQQLGEAADGPEVFGRVFLVINQDV